MDTFLVRLSLLKQNLPNLKATVGDRILQPWKHCQFQNNHLCQKGFSFSLLAFLCVFLLGACKIPALLYPLLRFLTLCVEISPFKHASPVVLDSVGYPVTQLIPLGTQFHCMQPLAITVSGHSLPYSSLSGLAKILSTFSTCCRDLWAFSSVLLGFYPPPPFAVFSPPNNAGQGHHIWRDCWKEATATLGHCSLSTIITCTLALQKGTGYGKAEMLFLLFLCIVVLSFTCSSKAVNDQLEMILNSCHTVCLLTWLSSGYVNFLSMSVGRSIKQIGILDGIVPKTSSIFQPTQACAAGCKCYSVEQTEKVMAPFLTVFLNAFQLYG